MSEAVRTSPVARVRPAQKEDKDVAAEIKEDCEIILVVSSRTSQGSTSLLAEDCMVRK